MPRNCVSLKRRGITSQLFLVFILILGSVAFSLLRTWSSVNAATSQTTEEKTKAQPESKSTSDNQDLKRFAVEINKPKGAPRTSLGKKDAHGELITVACSTCHATRAPNPENRNEKDFDEFHQGVSIAHGKLGCLSCHNEKDYDTLKLADGTRIDYSEVMKLCLQCHNQQARDFEHGAHGGMSGFWDLSKGPRRKNNCVDCHLPHAPRFPKMRPQFKPKDRFLEAEGGNHD